MQGVCNVEPKWWSQFHCVLVLVYVDNVEYGVDYN